IRFLFGAGEAGAYPSINRTVFSWIPVRERGMVNGINFSAGRIGAALALPGVAWLIAAIGWQWSFATLGIVGLGWALIWYFFFRDEPDQLASISPQEQEFILAHRQSQERVTGQNISIGKMLTDRNVLFLMGQYFASNFTFFFCLTWLFPHLMARFQLEAVEAAFYSSLPLVFGAVGNIVAGGLVDGLYRRGYLGKSRTITAALGFSLAAIGLFFSVGSETVGEATLFLAIAVLGADMTLSPSWAVCSDIGGIFSGTVSGAMNMFGNLGAFFTALSFPYLQAWFGADEPFFYIGVALNLLGILFWLGIKPSQKVKLTTT
ncbi:MFS transporter, partial [Persicitalea sp.]|uniref:MFS transporter n=1 Tax=Persicitalea sp. TaxID=3100273 RepID=UPI00359410FB